MAGRGPVNNTKEAVHQYVEVWIQTRLVSGPELLSSCGIPQGRSGGSPPTGPWSTAIGRPGVPHGRAVPWLPGAKPGWLFLSPLSTSLVKQGCRTHRDVSMLVACVLWNTGAYASHTRESAAPAVNVTEASRPCASGAGRSHTYEPVWRYPVPVHPGRKIVCR